MPGPVRAFAENQPVTSIVNTIRDLYAQQPVGSDNDLSASKYSHKPRQGYTQMLQDLQESVINAVVVYDQDRLVRQPKELEELLEVCDRARAWHIAAVSGEIASATPMTCSAPASWPPCMPRNPTTSPAGFAANSKTGRTRPPPWRPTTLRLPTGLQRHRTR
jgi:hypothetical protein